MVRITRFALLLLSLFITVTPIFAQEEEKVVTAEGVAVVQGSNMDIARDSAVSDAQQKAVEQAIGILIDSQTQVENFQVISDNILSQTKGFIKSYNIVRETKEDNLLRVTITAHVATGKLGESLSAIGILMGQMHKPRTMILVAEQNIGQEWVAWWWWHGGVSHHAQQTDMAIIDNTLMDKFVEKGFEMIDHQAAAQDIKVTNAYNVQDLSAQQARTLGNQAGAEVVITGKGLAKLYGNVGGGLKSVQADVSLRAVRTDTGQVLATATTHAAAVHISETTAGNDALKKAATEAADQMIPKILAIYSKEVGGTRSVNITVNGLNKTQFVKFKDVLRSQVRGIKGLNERSFQNGVAKMSVDSKNSAQIISDELSLKDFGTFAVEVISSTANQLELKVVPK